MCDPYRLRPKGQGAHALKQELLTTTVHRCLEISYLVIGFDSKHFGNKISVKYDAIYFV